MEVSIGRMAEVAPTRRKMRHPQHPFQVRTRPWQIAPFFIAPVLPGETMRNLMVMSKVATDPLKSPLVGWWQEYYLFYCKLRDLDGRDTFSAMMLDPTTSLSSFNHAALTEYYHAGSGISWVNECLKRVTTWYFRDGDEVWDTYKVGNLPTAKIMQDNVLSSAENNATRTTIADVNVDLNANSTITVSEVEQAMRQWELLRTQGMANMTFEDYLASFGVRPKEADLHRPELVRYHRHFEYPINHIDPSSGTPTSACVWKIAERADKDRFFAEPGFLFGVSVTRPKVYLSGQASTATDLLTDLYKWLPAVLRDDVNASLVELAANNTFFGGNGTTGGNTDAVWLDVKDLFIYGEQFVNFALTETDAGLVALPTATLQKRYASATDADALFANASPKNLIRQDGVVHLSIASSLRDTSQVV